MKAYLDSCICVYAEKEKIFNSLKDRYSSLEGNFE